ncbi:hypothetical protein [Flagellimonas pacifica]|uniref:Uncharacterized protein n=1 Tax=Flagellimonas pacifica TaxID=1247520 RepID=A0A285MUN0_9FLAO|nr:hypothetical protein [Allomuricauda parva]SNZ00882.1 hypothetical protein SAMN06265377_2709 [Allomuricauda parva]
MNLRFIELTLGNYTVSHGYENNKEILEDFKSNEPSKKLVAIDRIKSLSEKYILIDYLDGRWVYWEYEESYQYVKNLLTAK